jgi:hypothetical protein
MRSIRSLLVVVATALSLTVLAPSVAASTSPNALHLVKECSGFTGAPGSYCTFTSSNLAAIPIGSKAVYYGPELGANGHISSKVVLRAGKGNTATGWCLVDGATGNGACAFWSGTGKLHGFRAVVQVSVDPATGLWYWDGVYSLCRRH